MKGLMIVALTLALAGIADAEKGADLVARWAAGELHVSDATDKDAESTEAESAETDVAEQDAEFVGPPAPANVPTAADTAPYHQERVALDRAMTKLRFRRATMRRVDRVVANAEKKLAEWKANPTWTETKTVKEKRRCTGCGGDGVYLTKKCTVCDGKGYVIDRRQETETHRRDIAGAEKIVARYHAQQEKIHTEVEALEAEVAKLKAAIPE